MLVGYYENLRDDTKYLVVYNETKTALRVHIYSEMSPDDRVRELSGEPLKDGILTMSNARSKNLVNYLIGAVNIQTVSGQVSVYGNYQEVQNILDEFNRVRVYQFSEDDILNDEISHDFNGVVVGRKWEAADNSCSYKYTTEKKKFLSVGFSHDGTQMNLGSGTGFPRPKRLKFQELSKNQSNRLVTASVKDVDYTLLREMVDLDWYQDSEGVYKKDYKAITNKEEFYEYFLDPIIEYYKEHGELWVATDTEATGLNIWDLRKDNPEVDKMVTMQFSWKEDQGVIIFLDMLYLDNVPMEWALDRVNWIIDEKRNKKKVLKSDGEIVEVDTSKVSLIGFNSPFDHRVFYHHGLRPHFDHDVLQMVFNLNPNAIKMAGGNSLTSVVKRMKGIHIPELRDMLGKGNEGKFNHLSDIEVAKVYGCSDTDHTREAFFYVKKLTSKKMFDSYVKYDMPLNNHLARTEYHGIRTDKKKMEKMNDILEGDLEQLREFMFEYVGSMIVLKQSLNLLRIQAKLGAISEEEYELEVSKIQTQGEHRYEFEMKSADQRRVLYDLLGYPILGYTPDEKNPLPSTDKYTLGKLKNYVLEEPSTYMKENVLSKKTGELLIDADEFNKYKYPLSVVMLTYSDLKKDHESYVQPILKNNMEDKLFKSFSMARIETRRIMNPLQTMKGAYKSALLPVDDDWYIWDWDMSQVEFRIMISLANALKLILKMHDPESDFHRETAALINDIEAYLVTGGQRGDAKGVSFGLPYGLGLRSMTANKFNGVVNDETLYKTQLDIDKFTKENGAVMEFLEEIRDQALKEYEGLSPEYKRFIGYAEDATIGRTENLMGFHRLYNLDDLDNKRKAQIRRWAGNYPIQSFAAELFRLILIRFLRRIEKEGLDKDIVWHLLIHDECMGSARKTVNPFLLTKIIKESCMVTLKGHTSYFIGINFGYSWADALDEDRELPVLFSQEICERWDAGELRDYDVNDPVRSVEEELHKFIKKRLNEVVLELDTKFQSGESKYLDTETIFSKFKNYTVRGYITTHFKSYDKNIKKYIKGVDGVNPKYEMVCFVDFLREVYGLQQPVRIDGRIITVNEYLVEHGWEVLEDDILDNVIELDFGRHEEEPEVQDEEFNFLGYIGDALDMEMDKDFDVKVRQEVLSISDTGFDTEIWADEFDFMAEEEELVGFMVRKEGTNRLSFVLETVTINMHSRKNQLKLMRYLQSNKSKEGNIVILKIAGHTDMFRYLPYDFDYAELDRFIEEIDPSPVAI